MPKFVLFTCLLLISKFGFSQTNVVSWSYSAKKIDDRTYELRIAASVQSSWHIYSQTTPQGGPLPTKFQYNKNPLITLGGKTNEKGRLVKKYEDVFDIDVKYFDGNVVFTQLIKLKGKVKTNVTGSIEFMACNDEQCLPPATVNFTIPIQ